MGSAIGRYGGAAASVAAARKGKETVKREPLPDARAGVISNRNAAARWATALIVAT